MNMPLTLVNGIMRQKVLERVDSQRRRGTGEDDDEGATGTFAYCRLHGLAGRPTGANKESKSF